MKESRPRSVLLILALAVALAAAPRSAGAQESDVLLESIGASFSVGLYHMHLIISMAADGYAAGVYSLDEVKNLLAEQQQSVNMYGSYLQRIQEEVALTEDDTQILHMLYYCAEKIDAFNKSFQMFLEKPDEDTAKAFEQNRQASARALEKIINIE